MSFHTACAVGRQNDALAPFGGYKQSGFGREFGLLGLESFPEPKAIIGNQALRSTTQGRFSMSKVWLVTGSASGLGRNIAEAVLESGDRLVATARDPRRLEDLAQKYGDQVRTAALDVVDETAAQAAVQMAVAAFGRLDVVVNNAGYGDIAPFEQLSSERFRAVVDTNLYGVVNVSRAAIPIMRKQKSGCILQISSVGGRLARPGSSPYLAAMWAVGGFTESLALEVAPFGVKVCALEPGGMRTNWGVRANQETPELLPDYEPSVGAVAKALKSYCGHEMSDPVNVAQDVLQQAASDRLPPQLQIGSDAVWLRQRGRGYARSRGCPLARNQLVDRF